MTSVCFDNSIDKLVEVLKFYQLACCPKTKVNLVCDSDGIGILIGYNKHDIKEVNTIIQSYIPKHMLQNYVCPSKIIQGIDLHNFLHLIEQIYLLKEEDRKEITFYISDYDPCNLNILVVSENRKSQRVYRMFELPHISPILNTKVINDITYDYVLDVSAIKLYKTCTDMLKCCRIMEKKTVVEQQETEEKSKRKRSRISEMSDKNYKKSRDEYDEESNADSSDDLIVTIKVKKDGSERQLLSEQQNVLLSADPNVTTKFTLSMLMADPHLEQEISFKVNDVSPSYPNSNKGLFVGYYNIEKFIAALSPSVYYHNVKIYLKRDMPLYFLYQEELAEMHNNVANERQKGVKTEVYLLGDDLENRRHNC